MVTARNLTKKFGNLIAVNDVSFSVEPGEFVFLTGASGSGKTTLIRMILRDLKPDGGELTVIDQSVKKITSKELPQYRRQIGTVFQDFKLLSDRNVWENVALPLQVRGIKPGDIAATVKIALEMVSLSDHALLFPSQLSGGEIQRVAIARAVVGKPKLILADEPTGNLDPKTGRIIADLLKDIHTELKTTVIMATHNADIVNHFSMRVISLDKGKIIKDTAKGKYDETP
jgi:cell division transport system ATP-binding protein